MCPYFCKILFVVLYRKFRMSLFKKKIPSICPYSEVQGWQVCVCLQ